MIEGTPLGLIFQETFNKFMIGAAYRWSAFHEVDGRISDGMYIGYAYDLGATNLDNYNSGSHEIFLRYEIFKTIKNYNSILLK
jgi:hypothetical protein